MKHGKRYSLSEYTTIVEADTLTNGKPCYCAWFVEMQGVIGQGDTIEAALKDRDVAAYLLLEDHAYDMPEPIKVVRVLTSKASWWPEATAGTSVPYTTTSAITTTPAPKKGKGKK